ncbi:MAG: hypothetical protein ABFS32_16500, partial [Bacteroidota bacterium]
SKTSSKAFKDSDKSIPEIASSLGVDAVVEASVSCIGGDSVCIQIQLVSAYPEEKQLWVQEYITDKSQIENLYHKVTKQISEEINVMLTPQEESLLAESKAVDPDAYDAYLKGKYYWDQLTPEGLQKALEYFNLAIEKDPDWGPPYAGIAEFWIGMRQMGLAPSSVTIPNIYKYLDKATELDPNSANTIYVNALASIWTGFDWEKGEMELLKVLEINPSDAYAHAYYGHLLMYPKRGDEALVYSERSLELDPLNPLLQGLNAVVLFHTNNYQKALEQAKMVISVVPGHPLGLDILWASNHELGNYEEAIQAMILNLHLDDESSSRIMNTFKEQGHIAAYQVTVDVIEEGAQENDAIKFRLAHIYTILGNIEKAMDMLDELYEIRGPGLPYMMTESNSLQQLKAHPRYIELHKKMNLPLE